ncbi:MAG TPA: SMP-30/gluconolactonase/LRE family protein [Ilumatobacteraceae bacterium]|nr:SMP-30/gluconolactonase/LRE family protein [Ilumatobacteraceae bacterium]
MASNVSADPVPDFQVIAEGTRFPEGPVAMPDGSLLYVEVRGGTLSRVTSNGSIEEVAQLCPGGHGGANGAAIGPDGAAYVCNNGGFPWSEVNDMLLPVDLATGSTIPPGYTGGWINRVDLATGESRVLYREYDGVRLNGPNDIVFDTAGGFWFTDMGKADHRSWDKGGVYYAQPDGSSVTRQVWPLLTPNGVGLSPDGQTLYVAETNTGRLWAFDLDGPGRVRRPAGLGHGGRLLAQTTAHLDSLAVDSAGNVVVAALANGLCVVSPDGSSVRFIAMPDSFTTNVCFGGPELRTAYVTQSDSGRIIAFDWPRPGLPLAF